MASRVKHELIEIDDSTEEEHEEEEPKAPQPPPLKAVGWSRREPTPEAITCPRSSSPPLVAAPSGGPPGVSLDQQHESLIESMINQCVSFHRKLSTYEPLMTFAQRQKWTRHLSSLRDCVALEGRQSPESDEHRADYVALRRPAPTRRVYKKRRSTARRGTARAATSRSATSRATSSRTYSSSASVPRPSSSARVTSTASFQKAKQTATRLHAQMARAKSAGKARVKSEPRSGTSSSSSRVKKERA